MGLRDIGGSAPEIEVGEWVTGRPDDAGTAGKNVVLEFWGTHCGPCASAIPHLNELVDKYGSDKTLFLSLSQDTPDVVVRFLQKRPIKGAVAVDQDGRTFSAYGIRSIPHTVLIDTHGILRWQGHPNQFTEKLLATFLESDQVSAVENPSATLEVVPTSKPRPMFSFTINPNTSGPGGFGYGDDGKGWGVEFIGCSVVEAIRYVLDEESPLRMRVEGIPPTGRWDIEMRSTLPLKPAVAKKATIEALCGIFDIKLRRVLEQKEGWKLICPHPRLTDMSELGGGMSISCSKKELVAANITLGRLIKVLEPALGVFLLDGTHLSGKYDFKVPVTSVEEARESLINEHGIILEPMVWDVEMVVLQMSEAAFS